MTNLTTTGTRIVKPENQRQILLSPESFNLYPYTFYGELDRTYDFIPGYSAEYRHILVAIGAGEYLLIVSSNIG
jgi:hypothetical protein